MSRGRKSLIIEISSDWQKYYLKNIGTYLQLIINSLAECNIENYKSNFQLLEGILKNKGKSISKVREDEMLCKIPKNWFWAKLPDVCEISTGTKDVNEGHPDGVYPFFTCAQEPLRSNTYSFNDDCILLPGNGANVGYVNRYKGKFELYQRTYCLHKINNSVSVDFLELYMRGFWKNNLGQQFGSGINYLRISNFTNFVIPIPPSEMQTEILNFLKDFEKNSLKTVGYYFNSEIEKKIVAYHKSQVEGAQLSTELSHQLDLVKKLRQQFLQEAVQGKLVPQNPNDVPASELLKKIKAEKQKLISEGKLKKEKEFPPIKAEEIPFEIPESWVWCRLGEICNTITKGSSPTWQGVKYVEKEKGILFITSKNVDSFVIDLTKATYVEEKFNEIEPRSILKKGDLLTNIVGASIGRTALYNLNLIANINQAVCIIRIEHNLISKDYLLKLMNSDLAIKMMIETQFAPGRANLSMGNIALFPIPIPPLSEQHRIVQKLDELMQTSDALEASIKESTAQNEKLLQQVLREALRGDAETTKNEVKINEFIPSNVDYYKRSVLAAEIVWQLHKEPTLGHLKLQKLIYLCQKSAEMQLPTNFLRQAMGPYDPRLMRSIDKQLNLKKWFTFKQGEMLKYKPLEKAGAHQNDYIKYFSAEKDNIQFIIDTFKNIKSNVVEIVATLFACLENMQDEKIIFSEAMLIQRFYDWSEEKKKFTEKEIIRVYTRMKEKGIIPKGYNI